MKTIIKEAEGLLIMAMGEERHIVEPPLPQMYHLIEWAGFDTGILISPTLEMERYIKG
ncbi:hypothetical protein RRU94_18570 [Domibacillus sp. DTU_2020_1001157_1_SI_ALB_TIR_016]|uniref:hypothetical protein n=1 Tax=Domibacillus sp. DTU_2020_1001157_1_SI_ALB_TIR_016 TaxID=3077789 RepID=UPI0028E5241E|nr:hypothetical protein [Domibacillus sp. DTU_2020_1001157_1_SI_ALB_TIR_016]WNS79533.1 hypothetical protein RRU94_18570 [Domibacillus sp. DTU_2020_1001157_1_SI_ALB_TIR_016]